jgi:hypothetical protein
MQQLKRFVDKDVASRYYDALESKLQEAQTQPQSLDGKCKKLEPINQQNPSAGEMERTF